MLMLTLRPLAIVDPHELLLLPPFDPFKRLMIATFVKFKPLALPA